MRTRWDWRAGTRGALPVILVTLAMLAGAGCSQVFGPTEPDANWRAHDRGRFTFYVRPGSFAEKHVDSFSEVLEDQYDYTVATLSLRYNGRIFAFLYDSAADARCQFDRSGTAYPDTEAINVVCTGPLDANLYWLLAHEANHVIIRNGMGRPGTTFINEGLASAVISERYHRLGRQLLLAWTRTQAATIPPLASLVDDSRWSDFDSDVSYKSSASFLAYLLDVHGLARLRQLYNVPSKDFARRFEQTYGQSLERVEADWQRFCSGRTNW